MTVSASKAANHRKFVNGLPEVTGQKGLTPSALISLFLEKKGGWKYSEVTKI
jgi:hypothetical protein